MRKHICFVLLVVVSLMIISGCKENVPEIEAHQITFNFENGSNNLVMDVLDGGLVIEPETPLKTGHEFVGWYDGDTPYTFNQPVDSNINLTARWVVKSYPFKVLDFKGNILVDENLPYGTYFKDMIPESPFMFGFEFAGYSSNANTMIDEAITLQPIYNNVTDFIQSYTFNAEIRKLATNQFSNAVLLENGELYMWGHNGSPYLLCGGFDHSYDTLTPTEISGQFDLQMNEIIVDVYLGSNGNYAITNQGRFFTWGRCFDCNLGLCEDDVIGHPTDITDYFQFGQEIIEQLYIIENYMIVVTESGKVYNSGSYIDNSNLDLVDNKQWVDQTGYFNFMPGESILKAKKSYDRSGGLLTSEGRLFLWGNNYSGALGLTEDVKSIEIPVDITNLFALNSNEYIIDFEFGNTHTLVLTNQGRVFGMGRNSVGQLGYDVSLSVQYGPVDITPNLDLNPSEQIIQVICNFVNNSIFITNQGRAIALGSNKFSKFSLSEIEYFSDPIDITDAFGYDEDTYKQWIIAPKYVIYASKYQISVSGFRTFEFYFE
ncbi:InlB B-repeat-containing protein [Paracholeplasma manati]|uniref:InlB B-repeat-containing protein n=1 Tax=Paracholeplasma manati TaxID=591373 RepID=UPI00240804AD|nr:InlB B-repeat-containing protein [Paracholeplasma manati]MDG0888368.1 InlB B-repeat-containing protein [Paracholeplasma manati]